jgi:hypothetical protein
MIKIYFVEAAKGVALASAVATLYAFLVVFFS